MTKNKQKKKQKSSQKLQNNSSRILEQRITAMSASFSGPLPPPNILEGYEKILPGAADRIITMAETQLNHRHDMESTVIKSNVKNEHTGMLLAFCLTIALMAFGFYLILNDKETAGYFAVFGPVVFHGVNYVYNKKREEKSLEKPKQE